MSRNRIGYRDALGIQPPTTSLLVAQTRNGKQQKPRRDVSPAMDLHQDGMSGVFTQPGQNQTTIRIEKGYGEHEAMSKCMIFHYAKPIDTMNMMYATTIRPYNMMVAFEQIGYQVLPVIGYAKERRRAIDRVKADILKGRPVDFVYSETTNAPLSLVLTETKATSVSWLDHLFFRWLKRQTIPIGLFYRDIFWKFSAYAHSDPLPIHKRAVWSLLHWADWVGYLRWVDHLYLPTLAMNDYMPTKWPQDRVSSLPPGCIVSSLPAPNRHNSSKNLNLFFVGEITPSRRDLRPGLDAIQNLEGISLTLCCRESEWAQYQAHFMPIDPSKLRVVHAHGEGLAEYYAAADLFFMVWRPQTSETYLNFSMTTKVFEALGYGVPIVTNQGVGSEVERFIEQEQVGWVVSTMEELRDLLLYLKANPEIIAQKRRHVEIVRERHTWIARAQQVVDTLSTPKAR